MAPRHGDKSKALLMSFISRSNRFAAAGLSVQARGPLDNQQIAALAPSAFATAAHESRSSRYAYIPTASVIDGLRAQGFAPVAAKQGGSRVAGKANFTKHMIRFRHEGQAPALRSGGQAFPEIVLVNSHDGTSAYHIMAGIFRVVCLNGLIVAERTDGARSVAHKGNVVDNVIDASFEVLGESRRALGAAEAWSGVELGRDERLAFAESVRMLRFGDAEGETETPIKAEQMIEPRRREDHGTDLWSTFNVAQENAIRGGLSAMGRDANGRRRQTTTREVRGIDQDVKLNKALWHLSERMAALKGA